MSSTVIDDVLLYGVCTTLDNGEQWYTNLHHQKTGLKLRINDVITLHNFVDKELVLVAAKRKPDKPNSVWLVYFQLTDYNHRSGLELQQDSNIFFGETYYDMLESKVRTLNKEEMQKIRPILDRYSQTLHVTQIEGEIDKLPQNVIEVQEDTESTNTDTQSSITPTDTRNTFIEKSKSKVTRGSKKSSKKNESSVDLVRSRLRTRTKQINYHDEQSSEDDPEPEKKRVKQKKSKRSINKQDADAAKTTTQPVQQQLVQQTVGELQKQISQQQQQILQQQEYMKTISSQLHQLMSLIKDNQVQNETKLMDQNDSILPNVQRLPPILRGTDNNINQHSKTIGTDSGIQLDNLSGFPIHANHVTINYTPPSSQSNLPSFLDFATFFALQQRR